MEESFQTKILKEKSKQVAKNKKKFHIFIIIGLFILISFIFINFKEHFYTYYSKFFNVDEKIEGMEISNMDIALSKEKNKTDIKIKEDDIKINIFKECEKYNLQKELCNIKTLFQIVLKDLNEYSNNFLSNKNIKDIYPDKLSRVNNLKKEALEIFSKQDYNIAYKKISKAKTIFLFMLNQSKEQFKKNIDAAKSSFIDREEKKANIYISQAEKHFPDNIKMLNLKKRIKNMAIIKKLENQIQDAKLQKDFLLEISLIKRLKITDKLISKYDSRLLELEVTNKKLEFDNLVKETEELLNKGMIKESKLKLNLASELFPTNNILISLEEAIIAEEVTIKINILKSEVEKLIIEQNWITVKQKYDNILALDNSNYYAVEGIKIAIAINSLNLEIEKFNIKPLLLTKKNKLKIASNLTIKADKYKEQSAKLKKNLFLLKKNISLAKVPAIVNILSDGNTEITIRKVGKVGKVLNKKIELSPGKYTLEGKRKGYKTVLLEELISIEKKNITFKVVCNEPI